MKKLGLLFAAAAMAVSVNAQTVTESKTFDNFYIGINGGAQVKTTGEKRKKNRVQSNVSVAGSLQYSVWLLRVMFTSTITASTTCHSLRL